MAADGSGELVAFRHPVIRAEFSRWNAKVRVKTPRNLVPQDQLSWVPSGPLRETFERKSA